MSEKMFMQMLVFSDKKFNTDINLKTMHLSKGEVSRTIRIGLVNREKNQSQRIKVS